MRSFSRLSKVTSRRRNTKLGQENLAPLTHLRLPGGKTKQEARPQPLQAEPCTTQTMHIVSRSVLQQTTIYTIAMTLPAISAGHLNPGTPRRHPGKPRLQSLKKEARLNHARSHQFQHTGRCETPTTLPNPKPSTLNRPSSCFASSRSFLVASSRGLGPSGIGGSPAV